MPHAFQWRPRFIAMGKNRLDNVNAPGLVSFPHGPVSMASLDTAADLGAAFGPSNDEAS